MKAEPVVIVRPRRRRHTHRGHGGAWKVAYADFVTALMAFFLVMWIVSQNVGVRQAVAAYFRDPGAFETQASSKILDGGAGIHDVAGGAAGRQAAPASSDTALLERTAAQIRSTLGKMPEISALRDQVEMKVVADGLRIETLESARSCFFDTGSARMTPAAEALFAAIGRELSALPNGVMIEGHTDRRQYANQDGYTNWELSADRANAARRVMERAGLRAGQVNEVRGYADTQLRNPKDPMDARNRRVSILVKHVS